MADEILKYIFIMGLILVGLIASVALVMETYYHRHNMEFQKKEEKFNQDTKKYVKELQGFVDMLKGKQDGLNTKQMGIIMLQQEVILNLLESNILNNEENVERIRQIISDHSLEIPHEMLNLNKEDN